MELSYNAKFQELTLDELMIVDGGNLRKAADALIAILGVNYSMVAAVYAMAIVGAGPVAIGLALGGVGVAVYTMGRTLNFW